MVTKGKIKNWFGNREGKVLLWVLVPGTLVAATATLMIVLFGEFSGNKIIDCAVLAAVLLLNVLASERKRYLNNKLTLGYDLVKVIILIQRAPKGHNLGKAAHLAIQIHAWLVPDDATRAAQYHKAQEELFPKAPSHTTDDDECIPEKEGSR